MDFNAFLATGHLTKDPELRYTTSGTPVCSFSIAINRKYRQGEELKEEVCYIDVVQFGKAAEAHPNYLKKGSHVLVDGRLVQRRWETEDGQKRSKHEIMLETVIYLSKGQVQDGGEEPGYE